MFSVKLNENLEEITNTSLKYIGKPPVVLPDILRTISSLSLGEWYSVEQLQCWGLNRFKIESLVRARYLSFGLGNTVFPIDGRLFYEMQFPVHAAAYPLRDWLCEPFPINTVWIGLPFCHLTHIRHSTALGLAHVIDHIDGAKIPFLGVLPFMNPSEFCIQHLHQINTLAVNSTKRLGILGGDHRVAWAILRALRSSIKDGSKLRYIHIDAHHDLYGPNQEIAADSVAHSNFLLNLVAEEIIDEAVLIGCRDKPAPVEHAIKCGYPIISIPEYQTVSKNLNKKIHTHLSVDFDILDPKIAPDVSSPIEGGWSVEHLIATIKKIFQAETINSVSFVEVGPIEYPGLIAEKILTVLSE